MSNKRMTFFVGVLFVLMLMLGGCGVGDVNFNAPGSGQGGGSSPSPGGGGSSPSPSPNPPGGGGSSPSPGPVPPGGGNTTISLERAIGIAQADLTTRGIGANHIGSSTGTERGVRVWELEFRRTDNGRVIEYYIDMNTGAIVKFEREPL